MRVNEGYYIVVSVPISEVYEIVIGVNASGRYVVWHCKNGDDYFWGHYVMTYTQALKELCRLIEMEIR